VAVGDRGPRGGKAAPTSGEAARSRLAPLTPGELTAPMVVPNTLWQATNPLAYDGGRPTEITHLREFGQTEAGRHDDLRWGALQIVPTKADYILDLIRRTASGRSFRAWPAAPSR